MGLKDLILDPGSRELKQALEDQVALRRAALKDGNRSVGISNHHLSLRDGFQC